MANNPLSFVDPSGYCKESKVSGWKWALDGLKIIGGAVLCATGVGTAIGVSLIVSGVGDVVVDVMTECGASGKETAIASDVVQIVGGAAMLLNPVTAAAGAASIGSGVGGLAGGFAGEAIYEAVTGEQSDTAFAIGSSVGNILGGIAGDQVGKAIEAKNNLELVKAATSVETIKDGTNSGYYQDSTGKWHRPNGEFASNAEVGISSPVKTSTGNHGNSLSDPRTNYGYALVDKDTNEILKFCETLYPETRYSKSFLDRENAVMKVLVSGSKEDIHYWQYDMNKYFEYMYDEFPRLLNSIGW